MFEGFREFKGDTPCPAHLLTSFDMFSMPRYAANTRGGYRRFTFVSRAAAMVQVNVDGIWELPALYWFCGWQNPSGCRQYYLLDHDHRGVSKAVLIGWQGIPFRIVSTNDGRSRGAAAVACLSGCLTLALLVLRMPILALFPQRTVTRKPSRADLGAGDVFGRRARGPRRHVRLLHLLLFCR